MTKGGEETQPPIKIKITRHRGVSAHFSGTKLSRSAGNWNSWDQAVAIYFRTQTLLGYLRGTIPCPDASDEEGYANWMHNNDIAAGEILTALDVDEHGYVDADNDTCAAIYNKMKARHANEGPIKQINLISDALSSRINKSDKDIVGKVQKICTNIRDAFQMGSITQDLLTSTALLYAISDDFPHLRTMIVRDLSEPRAVSTDPHEYLPAIRNLIEREATLKRDLDSRGSNSDSAMVAQGNRGGKTRPTVVCDNCRGQFHIKKYCIRPGGDMEGQTLEASKAKKQADYAARNGGGKQKVPVPSLPHPNSLDSPLPTLLN
ncbi:hypothetical protein D9611_012829 [Ephemerocybe angulata]|uniref:Uncharacterized protein n=1 Tax=Ephemerocybe angulata TaxID=980116 RepID=A0A8H5BCT8_9AGAR|nr:hypothetical protein D9611_012829 [Tulosesus angulatus]